MVIIYNWYISDQKKRVVKVIARNRKKSGFSAPKGSFMADVKKRIIPEHAPFGIKALIVYSLFMTLLYAFYFLVGMNFPLAVLFGSIIEGSSAFFLNLFSVLVFATVTYGLIKRRKWCYIFSIVWFLLNIFNSLFSIFLKNPSFFRVMEQFSLISFLTVIFINGLIIWYLIEQKEYFFNHNKKFKHKRITHKERVLISILAGFWIVVLVIGVIMSVRLYLDMTSKVDSVMKIVAPKDSTDAKIYCDSLSGGDKDVCYVVLATIKHVESTNDISSLCSKISSIFYRYTCYRAAI